MKTTKLLIVSVLVAAFALTSCEKYLEPENKKAGGETADGYFTNDPQALLVYAYSLLKPVMTGNQSIFCDGTDLYSPSRGNSPSQFHDFSLTPENSDVEDFYKNTYACINMANAAIYYAGESNAKICAEAIFVRSYCYYLLSQQFGRVPYITTYVNNAERNYPLTETADLYAGLINDLKGIVDSPELSAGLSVGHATQAAVAALLAKVNLAAGWDLATTGNASTGEYSVSDKTYFTQAAEWAEKAVTLNGNTTLGLTFEELWSPKNVNNAEEIFSVQYERAGYPGVEATGGHGLQNTFGNYYGDCTSTGLKYVNSEKAPTVKSNTMWEQGDARYEATFMTTMYNYKDTWGTEGYYAYYNVEDLSAMPIAYKYFPAYTTKAAAEAWLTEHQAQFVKGDYVNAPQAIIMSDPAIVFTFNADGSVAKTENKPYNESLIGNTMNFTPAVKKWDDLESKQLGLSAGVRTNDYRDVVVLHASDTYLDAAEAYLLAGDATKALEKINAVRERAGLPALASLAAYEPTYNVPSGYTDKEIDLILDERARETYAELHRWADLRRTKQLVRYNKAFNTFFSEANFNGKWYRPIPQAEINSNTALTSESQNAGY